MNENITPIETVYNGYRFRSRLEARWAVFFDYMGIEYEYETEGYEFGEYKYLPDFWLPEYKLHAEVKGITCRGQIPKADAEKMSWMIDYDGPCSNGIILLGNIPYQRYASDLNWAVWRWHGSGLAYGWFMCSETPKGHFEVYDYQSAPHFFKETDDIIVTSSNVWYYPKEKCDIPANINSRVENALLAARQARFEHGEKPII